MSVHNLDIFTVKLLYHFQRPSATDNSYKDSIKNMYGQKPCVPSTLYSGKPPCPIIHQTALSAVNDAPHRLPSPCALSINVPMPIAPAGIVPEGEALFLIQSPKCFCPHKENGKSHFTITQILPICPL